MRAISVESYGRVGAESLASLRCTAREAAIHGRLQSTTSALVQELCGDLEIAVLFMNADASLLSKGAMRHKAGAGIIPIGRVVVKATAAAGEWPA